MKPIVTKIPSVHHMDRTELNALRNRLFKIKDWGPEQKSLWYQVKSRLAELNGKKPCGIGRKPRGRWVS